MSLRLAVVTVLSGCSFIYNPNNIGGSNDGRMVDTEHVVDVNPSALNLDFSYPKIINEGVGEGGSRPAVVVVRGEEISPGATVTVVPATGAATQISLGTITLSEDHLWIAIEISVPVDTDQDETTPGKIAADVPLNITVDNGNGTTKTVSSTSLHFLDQLKTPPTTAPASMKLFSQVDVTGATTFATGTTAKRVVITSMSSISFAGEITADAGTNPAAGPGGCPGGAAGNAATGSTADGTPCSTGGTPPTFLGGGAGGAGYTTVGAPGSNGITGGGTGGGVTGDVQISSYATNYSGGGGGAGAAGGGGGGTIELTAGGNLTVTAAGVDAISAQGGISSSGGGGAGGTILIRSGGALSIAAALDVNNRNGSNASGGAGSVGRSRVDAAGTIPTAGYNGPMFVTVPSTVTDQTTSMITLRGHAGDMLTGQVYDKDDNALMDGAFNVAFGGNSMATPTIKLTPGFNKVCVSVPNGNRFSAPESTNCADLVYLP